MEFEQALVEALETAVTEENPRYWVERDHKGRWLTRLRLDDGRVCHPKYIGNTERAHNRARLLVALKNLDANNPVKPGKLLYSALLNGGIDEHLPMLLRALEDHLPTSVQPGGRWYAALENVDGSWTVPHRGAFTGPSAQVHARLISAIFELSCMCAMPAELFTNIWLPTDEPDLPPDIIYEDDPIFIRIWAEKSASSK